MSSCALTQAKTAAPARSAAPLTAFQRQCACGTHSIGGATCDACKEKQRSTARSGGGASAASGNPNPSGAPRAPHKGETVCTGGKLIPKVMREHRAGNCVQVHEDTHVADAGPAEACRRVQICIDRGDGGVPPEELDPTYPKEMLGGLCQSTYDKYVTENSPNTEFKAYSAEAECLQNTIDAQCGEAKKRDSNIGGGIGLAVTGIGGGIGGGFAGAALAPKLHAKPGVAGAAGAAIGAAAGAGLGWLIGSLIGSAAAGKQASTEDCKSINDELTECGIAIKEYKGIAPAPIPFEPDGRIIKSLTRGITKPQAAGPDTSSEERAPQAQQTGTELAPMQARAPAGMRLSMAARIAQDDDNPQTTFVPHAFRSPGQPLDARTRALMEPRFNHDFSRVRIHTDADAAASAKALAAHAFSIGDHIIFDSGRFSPGTGDGKRLLAHELAHVVQNSQNAGSAPARSLSQATDSSEEEATDAAQGVIAGRNVEIEQSPAAAIQRDKTGRNVGIVAAVLGGLGVAALIAWAAGAFDSKKKKEPAKPETAKPETTNPEQTKPKLTFEEALKEGADVLKPEFGLTEGRRTGPDPGDGYDASEWKESLSSGGGGDVVPLSVLQSTTSSSWTAFDHIIKNIGKDVPSSTGGKTKWSFDCFEYVEVLRLYALWRTMEPADFDKSFPKLEIGFNAPRINAEWQKAFRADAPKQRPYQFSDPKDVIQGGEMKFGVTTQEPVKKTWTEILDEAPVGSQVIWSNFEAGKRCAKDKTLDFCAYANENATKLGKDSYSAHPFGVTNEATIRNEIAKAVLEYDAQHTREYQILPDKKKEGFVDDYVKKRLAGYMDKNIYISAVRYPVNPVGPAPAGKPASGGGT